MVSPRASFNQDVSRRYTERVPSGMLPAVEIDGEVFTESDQVLYMLEEVTFLSWSVVKHQAFA